MIGGASEFNFQLENTPSCPFQILGGLHRDGVWSEVGHGQRGWAERGWQPFGTVRSAQKGNPMETVDNGKNILFHVEGVDCVAIIPKRLACRPQRLKINWLHCY